MAKWRLSGALAGALVVAISTLWPVPSNALTFDFSFTSAAGTVTGEIDGLTANGTGEAATHVFIDSAPFSVGFTLPHDTINAVHDNTFNVNASGQITSFFYLAFVDATPGPGFVYDLCISSAGPCAFGGDTTLINFLLTGTLTTGSAVASSTINFTSPSPSAVPLPAALPLFATGLAGLGLLGWRRKKKAAPLNA